MQLRILKGPDLFGGESLIDPHKPKPVPDIGKSSGEAMDRCIIVIWRRRDPQPLHPWRGRLDTTRESRRAEDMSN